MPPPAELTVPGKAFVAGEYSVLERGQPALVLAVDLRLRASVRELPGRAVELVRRPGGHWVRGELTRAGVSWSSGIPGELRFAARAVEIAARLCAEEGLPPLGFEAAFEDDLAREGRKLGVGGSAAASVLGVRAACAAQGREATPREAMCLAAAAHWIEQGARGSGADVAACALGGLVEVRTRHAWTGVDEPLRGGVRDLLAHPPLEGRAIAVPPGLRFLLAWTGAPADTRRLVDEVLAFARARPGRWRHHAGVLSAQETALREAIERGDPPGALDAVRRAAAAMGALGDEAQAPIVTQDLARACAVASSAGAGGTSAGAAGKPSGAGGGDCAIVLAWEDAADRARAALGVAGYLALEVAPAVP
jgi:phosphomevalonate kinase